MQYQQGTQRIEIIVRKEASGGQDGAKETESENVSSTGTQTETQTSGGLTARQKRIIKTNTTHILAFTKQMAQMGMNYYIQGIGLRTGDQSLQESVERQVELVEDGTNFASSISMGALYGSWGGWVGTLVGASIGGLTSAASIASREKGRERTFNYKVFKENNAIEYQRARASISLTTGRLR